MVPVKYEVYLAYAVYHLIEYVVYNPNQLPDLMEAVSNPNQLPEVGRAQLPQLT